MDTLLDLATYTQYGNQDQGGTCPAWMTARGRHIIAATGHDEADVQDVLARLLAHNITRQQATQILAA